MKIEFEDQSYIEATKSKEPNKIIITIAAKDYNDPQKTIANSVEITITELQKLLEGIV